MHGIAICEVLREEIRQPAAAQRIGAAFRSLPERALEGLDRVLAVFIDTRVAYLRRGIDQLGERAGSDERRAAAEAHLQNAERRRARASALARTLRAENARCITSCDIDARTVQRLLALLQEHCKEAYLSLNEIQRAWMEIEDTPGMIEQMYEYLYDLYPPLFPQILRSMLSEEEMAAVDDPQLA
jgi:hypothetical protein